MAIALYDYQRDAIRKMKNGCILCGGVGSGKSRTSLAYYYQLMGGNLDSEEYIPMFDPKDLYIITTARKRDTLEWEGELAHFCMSPDPTYSLYKNKIVIDSWNNIQKYADIQGAFFILDEQRLVSYGKWTKAFLKLAKQNEWILLSATPGDTWQDYMPVFIANGFYRNKTQFTSEHVVYDHRVKFPRIDRYLNTGRLVRLRNSILITMDFERKTEAHHETVLVNYDKRTYDWIKRNHWDLWNDKPYDTAAGVCQGLRRVVNTSDSRQVALLEILEKHTRAIIFYNYDFELDLLLDIFNDSVYAVGQWNGHKHQEIPEGDKWVYLVQYTAGCEGWNCIKTDTIIFYSQNYSYKVMIQAAGRIDRLNTPFIDLYYYHLKSDSSIDLAISRALKNKKTFNEGSFINVSNRRKSGVQEVLAKDEKPGRP